MTGLSLKGLTVELKSTGKALVDGVDLEVSPGGRLALIGESGSGKSLTALAAAGLLPRSMRVRGQALVEGVDMAGAPERERAALRGRGIAVVFQEPLAALDPLMKLGRQIAGPLALYRGLRGKEAEAEVLGLLDRVRLPDRPRIAASYPHQLSGGQRQRAALAMALACGPRILIADEPTTALDATVQAELMDLLDALVEETGMALLFITHDLPLAARIAPRAAVMKDGKIVEEGALADLEANPRTEYARSLIESARRLQAPFGDL